MFPMVHDKSAYGSLRSASQEQYTIEEDAIR